MQREEKENQGQGDVDNMVVEYRKLRNLRLSALGEDEFEKLVDVLVKARPIEDNYEFKIMKHKPRLQS